ncbi:uncharacterized protein LOC131598466 [Vicia villosa]|uniref:uncharacterized protein LOC131598466 n=1 Tax=Vicia villosa TaxID=3911 RepID=UPI00273BB3B6|nr:uncharacterized protein LOC131598466 [Vicia villosa]
MLRISAPFLYWDDVKKIFTKAASGQCKVLHCATVISVLNVIWQTRNKVRFQNIGFDVSFSISSILDCVSLAANNVVASYLNMHDFILLKSFRVLFRPPKAPRIVEVMWQPPPRNWVKINCDEASVSPSGNSACGGIVRNSEGGFLGTYAIRLGLSSSLIVELFGAIFTIEFAHENNWKSLWLETDSMAVVKAFRSPFLVPWHTRNH